MNHLLRFTAIVTFCLFCSLLSPAQTTNAYTVSTTWNVPAGINTIIVRVYGGGGGAGGRDCGAGCTNAAGGPVGYVYASYAVAPGDVIGIYPGGKGTDGANNATNTGGGAAGVSTYNAAYNGGTGGNAGGSGSSGGGGGGGASSVVTINSVIRIVAGGGGGGGGMANSPNSGRAGSSGTSANGTSNTGGNGQPSVGDGGGGGGGGGGHYGSLGGTVYTVGAEKAGNGGYRGNNAVNGAAITFYDNYSTWPNAGRIEITYSNVIAGGTTSSDQPLCGSQQPSELSLSGFFGSSIQWHYSDNNSSWNNIFGATSPILSSSQIGTLTATRYYRVLIDGSAASTITTITIANPAAGITPSGSGTEADPYLISSMGNLNWITADASRWDKHYKQTGNIDASATSTTCYNSGQGWNPIGDAATKFTGSYDGQDYSITGLYINRETTEYTGLFGFLSSAEIANISLVNIDLTGGKYVGALSGAAEGGTSITNVDVSGSINAYFYDHEAGVGGLAGWFYGNQGLVDQSSSTVNINCYDNTSMATCYGGGLLGVSEGGTCRNSFSTGNITIDGVYDGNVYAAGFVGSTSGQVMNCYATGSAEIWSAYSAIYTSVGGFSAKNNGTIANCYALGSCYNYDSYSGNSYAAGFTGHNSGQITNCYSTGYAYDNSMYGGLVANNSGTITNGFYDMDASIGDDGSGTAKTNAAMKSLTTFFNAGWDMKCETLNGNNDVWRISSSANNGYPTLSWQNYSMSCPQWVGSSNTTFGQNSNWGSNFIPAQGMDIVISPSAANNLVLPQNWMVGNITFNGAAKLIQAGNYNLTIGGTVTGGNASNYIQTNGSGLIKKNIPAGNLFTFPVGNSAYNPVTITNNSGGIDEFTVSILDEVYANGSNGAAVTGTRIQRTWNIGKASANGGSGIDFIFNWNSGETTGTLVTPSLYHYGTAWDKQTGTASSTATSLTYTGYTGSFSPFSVMEENAILPVNWLGFTVQKQNSTALLNWSTALEQGAESYTVQHSTNGSDWKNIGIKPADGNSSTIQQYSFIHPHPVAGLNNYRLLQRDIDGSENFSKIASVYFYDRPKVLAIYPNPVSNGILTVKLINPATVKVVNGAGALMLQKNLIAGETQLKLTHFLKGIYTINAGDETISFIIQ
jgi:hypothetical protein